MQADPTSARALMELQAATLFTADADGRLRHQNEPGYAPAEMDPAPRLFLGRTREGNVWRFRHDLPASLVRDLERICRAEPPLAGGAAPPRQGAAIRALLAAHAPPAGEWRGPAYLIPAGAAPPAGAMLIDATNAHLLAAHFPTERLARPDLDLGPIAAAVAGGSAVALCFCSRLTPRAAEAGVETAAAARGRGYASLAVAAWAAAVRAGGRLPLYSTAWSNMASQGVARRLGMRLYGEDWSLE